MGKWKSCKITTDEPTTAFTIPDILVGEDTNETLLVFPEEPRDRYDISKFDGPPKNELEASIGINTKVTLGVVGVISLIAIATVAIFVRVSAQISHARYSEQTSGFCT